jgi:hypothetical protein
VSRGASRSKHTRLLYPVQPSGRTDGVIPETRAIIGAESRRWELEGQAEG